MAAFGIYFPSSCISGHGELVGSDTPLFWTYFVACWRTIQAVLYKMFVFGFLTSLCKCVEGGHCHGIAFQTLMMFEHREQITADLTDSGLYMMLVVVIKRCYICMTSDLTRAETV